MKFVDSLIMSVKAGRGGNGCMSFLRERFKPTAAPTAATADAEAALYSKRRRTFRRSPTLSICTTSRERTATTARARRGTGAAGEDKIIYVPCGTLIYDAETGEGCADLVEPHDRFVAARGGRGGRGNRYFASSSRKAPRFCEQGEMGEEVKLRLELRLIADVGLVGLPNVGKSSILAAISNAQRRLRTIPSRRYLRTSAS